MKRRIDSKFLILPPYVSTSWSCVSALHCETSGSGIGEDVLIVVLENGVVIEVPGLAYEDIEEIFTAHAVSLEQEEGKGEKSIRESSKEAKKGSLFGFEQLFNLLSKGDEGGSGMILHHSEEHRNAEPLPKATLERIARVINDWSNGLELPQPEDGCRCFYCQVVGAARGKTDAAEQKKTPSEESVKDEDLVFSDWIVRQKSEQLYSVTNARDQKESYQVFLGDPIGCTCGKRECEHIIAVLRS